MVECQGATHNRCHFFLGLNIAKSKQRHERSINKKKKVLKEFISRAATTHVFNTFFVPRNRHRKEWMWKKGLTYDREFIKYPAKHIQHV